MQELPFIMDVVRRPRRSEFPARMKRLKLEAAEAKLPCFLFVTVQ